MIMGGGVRVVGMGNRRRRDSVHAHSMDAPAGE
jgi:hypothetical protein